jgi:hypothetical protein
VIGHLRVVGAGLQRQVAARELGLHRIGRQRLELAHECRLLRGESELVGEDARPEPDRDREPGGSQVEGLAGVDADAVDAVRLDLPDRTALHELGDGARPAREQHLQVARERRRHVEGHVDAIALGRRADARLLGVAVEGVLDREVDDLAVAVRCRGIRVREAARGVAACGADDQAARGRGAAEQQAAA